MHFKESRTLAKKNGLCFCVRLVRRFGPFIILDRGEVGLRKQAISLKMPIFADGGWLR